VAGKWEMEGEDMSGWGKTGGEGGSVPDKVNQEENQGAGTLYRTYSSRMSL